MYVRNIALYFSYVEYWPFFIKMLNERLGRCVFGIALWKCFGGLLFYYWPRLRRSRVRPSAEDVSEADTEAFH